MKQLDRFRNAKGEIWLNVASSTHVLEDFVNLDNNLFLRLLPYSGVVGKILPKKYQASLAEYRQAKQKAHLLQHDCRAPLDFPDGSVEHILCSHFLEHVYPAEMESIVRDFHRVLKNNGTLHIIVPDLKDQAERYLQRYKEGMADAADEFVKETLLSMEGRGTLKYRMLELNGGFGLQHRWMYDAPSMVARLVKAGFSILDENHTPSQSYRLNDGSVHIVACKQ